MALRTTVVGSWWWPEEHAHELRRHHDGELGEDESVELLNTCAAAAIAEQRELGLDEWTGGEFTDNFIDQMRRVRTASRSTRPRRTGVAPVRRYDAAAASTAASASPSPHASAISSYERRRASWSWTMVTTMTSSAA